MASGTTPAGYDWQHSEDPGVLQLVNVETHQNTGHTGGREIWGGGSGYR
ncbi:HNH endonuclease [Psychrobacillus sp. NPDC096623]